MRDDIVSIGRSERAEIADVRQHRIVVVGFVSFAFLLADECRFAELTEIDVAKTFGHFSAEQFAVAFAIGNDGCVSRQIARLHCFFVRIVFVVGACIAFRWVDDHNVAVGSKIVVVRHVDGCHCAHYEWRL